MKLHLHRFTDWAVFDKRGDTRAWVYYACMPFAAAAMLIVVAIFVCIIAPILLVVGVIGSACSWLANAGR